MADAVGTISAAGAAATLAAGNPNPRTAAALQARLSRYQRQLAACLDCPSARTAAGKRQIEELSQRISDARNRIRALEAGNPAAASAGNLSKNGDDAGRRTSVGSAAAAALPQQSARAAVGSLIDVFG